MLFICFDTILLCTLLLSYIPTLANSSVIVFSCSLFYCTLMTTVYFSVILTITLACLMICTWDSNHVRSKCFIICGGKEYRYSLYLIVKQHEIFMEGFLCGQGGYPHRSAWSRVSVWRWYLRGNTCLQWCAIRTGWAYRQIDKQRCLYRIKFAAYKGWNRCIL